MGKISTALRTNGLEVLRRNWNASYFGQSAAGIAQNIACLNTEFVLGLNAAGTGTVNLIGVDSFNRIVLGGPTVSTFTAITANGAIAPHASGLYVITKAGVAAMTLTAPTATTDDGVKITVTSSTAFAHTITATGLLGTGSASVNVATFAAFAGASIELIAYQAKWLVLNQNAITFS